MILQSSSSQLVFPPGGVRIGEGIGGAAVPWYLAGGVPVANAIGAYQAIGAASYAASKLNLVNPATHALVDTGHVPTWTTENGWVGEAAKYLVTDIVTQKGWTIAGRVKDYVTGSIFGSRSFNAFWQAISYSGTPATPLRFYNSLTGIYKDTAMPTSDFTFALSGRKLYVNGVYKDIITDSTFTITFVTWLLGHNRENNPTLLDPLDGKLLAIAFYDAEFTDATNLALHTALAALPNFS